MRSREKNVMLSSSIYSIPSALSSCFGRDDDDDDADVVLCSALLCIVHYCVYYPFLFAFLSLSLFHYSLSFLAFAFTSASASAFDIILITLHISFPLSSLFFPKQHTDRQILVSHPNSSIYPYPNQFVEPLFYSFPFTAATILLLLVLSHLVFFFCF